LNYPAGGRQVVETRLGSLQKYQFDTPDYNRWTGAAKWGGLGALGGGVAIGGLSSAFASNKLAAAVWGGITGALLIGGTTAIIGAARADNRRGTVRDLARQDAEHATKFDVDGRPPLPTADQIPTVVATIRAGKHVPGVSGSQIGSVVRFTDRFLEMQNVSVTQTQNTNGEPLISVGNVSGTTTSYDVAVREENRRHNTLGIGKVLYNTDGYSTLAEAKDAIDGKHSVVIVKEGKKYYVADFDAEDFGQISEKSSGMIISDPRVKAVYTNKNVYYPSTLRVGRSNKHDVAPASGRVFMFGQGQDIDKTPPASVVSMRGTPIGMYDTNAIGSRNRAADRFALMVDSIQPGDEWSGPGWTDRSEAIAHLLSDKSPGNQALVHVGNRYYIANTSRQSVQSPGRDYTLDEIVDQSTKGSYIHGIRTVEGADVVEVLEEQGGLYAPVGDWWVKANLDE
jgi:hypothetical protein